MSISNDANDDELITKVTKEDLPAFMADRRLHQTFYHRGKRVTYAEVGDIKGRPVIYVGASAQPRMFIAGMDTIAKFYGLRLIFLDRPGRGGTTMDDTTPIAKRIQWTTDATIDLISNHLNIPSRSCGLICVSAGSIYAIDLIRKTDLIDTSLPIIMVSPWIPGHLSGGLFFPRTFIPSNVIANVHNIVSPNLISGLDVLLQFSSGAMQSTKNLLGIKAKEKPHKRAVCCDELTSPEVFKYVLAEDLSGVGQDFLICLCKTPEIKKAWDCTWETLTQDNKVKATRWVIYWGEKDFMVPAKGIKWVEDNLPFVEVVKIPDSNHDELFFQLLVLKDALKRIKK